MEGLDREKLAVLQAYDEVYEGQNSARLNERIF